MSSRPVISKVLIRKLNEPLNEPFPISSGSQNATANVLALVILEDGTIGYGEGAPSTTFNGDSQALTFSALSDQLSFLEGQNISDVRSFLKKLDRRMPPERGAARAAVQMAVLDAWTRSQKIPLRSFFGGARKSVLSDVTVTLITPRKSRLAARKIARLGVQTIKIKVGCDLDEDEKRVLAVLAEAPRVRLIIDANQGYSAKKALDFLSRLKKRQIVPALFEQPVKREDLEGLFDVEKHGKVPVCADESAYSFKAVQNLFRRSFPSAVNIKLMKCGIIENIQIAELARKKGKILMIGGNIETALSMTCSAHFACGRGDFSFVDLDTPLWFSQKLWKGPSIGYRGLYDLSKVRAGLGMEPMPRLKKLAAL